MAQHELGRGDDAESVSTSLQTAPLPIACSLDMTDCNCMFTTVKAAGESGEGVSLESVCALASEIGARWCEREVVLGVRDQRRDGEAEKRLVGGLRAGWCRKRLTVSPE